MPAMAALLIVAGIQSIKREEVLDVWDIGWGPRLVMLVTFVLTLSLPVQYAVLAGVVLSVLVYLVSSAQDVRLMEIVPNPDGTYREQPAPAKLPSNAVTILHAYGNLFYAAAYKMEDLLPSASGSERPVVILRLRRSDSIASTFINVLEHYEEQLQACGGKLMLAGVSPRVKEQLDVTETTCDVLGDEDIFAATANIGEATKLAWEAAQAWLERETDEPSPVE
jgi:SulP family sulfate permease